MGRLRAEPDRAELAERDDAVLAVGQSREGVIVGLPGVVGLRPTSAPG